MSDETIKIEDAEPANVRITVNPRIYRNAAGIGFLYRNGREETYVADLSEVVFRRIRPSSIERDSFRTGIDVGIDTLERTIPHLIELSGNVEVYRVSESERRAWASNTEDLRRVTNALLDMQKIIIGRGNSK